jgi:hypothetical protein
MEYVIATTGQILQFSDIIKWDEDHICTPAALTLAEQARFSVFPLRDVPMPTYNALTENCQPGAALVNGEWVKTWTTVPASAAEVHVRAVAAADAELARVLSGGFAFNGVTWPCDLEFQSHLQVFVLAFFTGILPDTGTAVLSDASGAGHALGKTETIALASASLLYVQNAYAACRTAKGM